MPTVKTLLLEGELLSSECDTLAIYYANAGSRFLQNIKLEDVHKRLV
jgi:hypothetical protein